MLIVLNHALSADCSAATNYQDDVLPILKRLCLNCHNSDDAEAGLDLSTFESLQAGGSGGPIVKPGLPDSSVLYLVMSHHEDYEAMPPEQPRVSADTLKTIRSWIAGGLIASAGGKSQLREMTFNVSAGSTKRPEKPAFPDKIPPMADVERTNPTPIVAMASSPFARLVAASGHGRIKLYGSAPGDGDDVPYGYLGSLPFNEGDMFDLRFSRNGSLLIAAGGIGAQSGRIVIYDVESAKRIATIGEEYDSILTADISPDHSMIAIGTSSRFIKVLLAKNGKLLHRIKKHTDWVTRVRFSPDGKLLATGDRNGGLHVWDAKGGGIVYTLDEHKEKISAICWRADSNVLVSGSNDGKIVMWDMKDGWATRSINAHTEKSINRYTRMTGVLGIAFGRNGQLITSGRDRKLRLWTAEAAPHSKPIQVQSLPLCVAYGAEEKFALVGTYDGSLYQLDLNERDIIRIGGE